MNRYLYLIPYIILGCICFSVPVQATNCSLAFVKFLNFLEREEIKKEILSLIAQNNRIKASNLARKILLTEQETAQWVRSLKSEGKLEWREEGGAGYWKINWRLIIEDIPNHHGVVKLSLKGDRLKSSDMVTGFLLNQRH